MSSTIRRLQSSGCGCPSTTPVQPDNLAIVPAGSMIVQAPCGENCSPPSSAQLSAIQQAGSESGCDSYRNPCVAANFFTPAIGKSGSMFATCASAWALPGLLLYFPGLGFLEVASASGNVITYRNLTIEPGTDILAGTCFHHDAPAPVTETGGGDDDSGEMEAASGLDALYGQEGNVPKKILPVDGQMLWACGGKWVRRAAGLMFYPVTLASLVSFNGAAANKTWTPALPNKPTKPACSLGLWAQLSVRISSASTSSGLFPTNAVDINGRRVVTAHAHPSYQHNNNEVMVNTNDSATITIEAKKLGSNGNMNIGVDLLGYWY